MTDDLGRDVYVDLPARRVATLAPSLTEMVFAVGGGPYVVGVGEPDNFPPAVDSLPRYSTYPPDFEAITALEPDLVLATDQVNSPRTAETLEALGIPTYFLSFRSVEDVVEGLIEVGSLVGLHERGESAADSLRHRIDDLQEILEGVDERPSVLFLIGPETLFAYGEESYVHELIELAGGRSTTADIETSAPVLSEEFVLARQPDVIIGSWPDSVGAVDLLQHHPTWDAVPAVANDRIYSVHPDLISRPGPRLIEGAFQMARHLHPDRFQVMDRWNREPSPSSSAAGVQRERDAEASD